MQNVANTPPPGHIVVNGKRYETRTDYLVWADIMLHAQDELFDQPQHPEEIVHNWGVLAEMQRMAFARVLPEPHADVFAAMMDFMKGYPRVDNGHSREQAVDGAKTYSLRHDMNLIVLAIRNQSGIDLSFRRFTRAPFEPFHWWLFLLEFQSLDESHLITNMMRWRAYDGKDKELLRRRDRVALPREHTKSEQAFLDALDELFPNT